MFKENEKTVLILGAGASIPYGYPTGEGLLEKIKQFLRTNNNYSGYKNFLQLIHDISPLNIDYFLRNNPSFQNLGKTIIAYCLLQCENIKHFTNNDDNWYRYLYHAIVSGCSDLSDVKESLQNLQIITFNYDLSLEYYLINTINKTELFKDENSVLCPEDLNIHHVYGQLYSYDISKFSIRSFRNFSGKEFSNFYGYFLNQADVYGIPSPESYEIKIDYIDTFRIGQDIDIMPNPSTDQKSLTEEQKDIQKFIKEANNLYVLGYGFDVNNNDIIGLKEFFNHNEGGLKKYFHYTNYDNSGRIRRLVENFKKSRKHYDINGDMEIIESGAGKSVAEALLYDFDLSPNFD